MDPWKTCLLVAAALSTAQPAATFELTDYLLGADLVVSGRVVVLGNGPVISVAIDSVLAGVVPSDTLHLMTPVLTHASSANWIANVRKTMRSRASKVLKDWRSSPWTGREAVEALYLSSSCDGWSEEAPTKCLA